MASEQIWFWHKYPSPSRFKAQNRQQIVATMPEWGVDDWLRWITTYMQRQKHKGGEQNESLRANVYEMQRQNLAVRGLARQIPDGKGRDKTQHGRAHRTQK